MSVVKPPLGWCWVISPEIKSIIRILRYHPPGDPGDKPPSGENRPDISFSVSVSFLEVLASIRADDKDIIIIVNTLPLRLGHMRGDGHRCGWKATNIAAIRVHNIDVNSTAGIRFTIIQMRSDCHRVKKPAQVLCRVIGKLFGYSPREPSKTLPVCHRDSIWHAIVKEWYGFDCFGGSATARFGHPP